eukprot:gene32445-39233_t
MEEAFRLFKSTREFLTPVLAESAFLEKGMLTPEEFVRAGDKLIQACPSWRWEAGDKAKARSYLPANKQFLATYGVPSYQRVNSLNATEIIEDIEKGEGEDKELETDGKGDSFLEIEGQTISDEWATIKDTPKPIPTDTSDVDKAIGKMSDLDLEEEGLALDEATAVLDGAGGAGLKRARRYNISMTYDNYYRVPRIWMYGFDESGSVLTPEAVFEDVMQDYAKRTVTIDPHPHISSAHASIHPCQHAPAMLTIIKALQEGGNTPTVEQYFFIFLKFIQSVVPTIEYDYTTDVQAR